MALAALAFAVFFWVLVSFSLAVDVWHDRCTTNDQGCERGTADDVAAALQLVLAMGGGWLAAVCVGRGFRALYRGGGTESLRRHSLIALGIFVFWLCFPFLAFALSEA